MTKIVAAPNAKILSLDIETAPVLAHVWSLWKQNVGLNQIKEDWFIMSFCAKWMHRKTVIYQDQQHVPNMEDDSALLAALWELLNEADIIIVQNGIKFDVKKINARFFAHGMPPPAPYQIVDTLVVAKRHFGFTSNKLAYMTDKFCTIKKRKHEKFPGFELWVECLKRNPAAWQEMKVYNIDDVRSMEELYLKMRPWVEGHPNVSAIRGDDEMHCPKCGSDDVIQKGYRFTTQGGKYARFRCNCCGGWSRGRFAEKVAGSKTRLVN